MHGRRGWFIDQEFLRKRIDNAVSSKGYNLYLSKGPGHRLHIGKPLKNATVDVHLAKFKLSSDLPWLETFLNDSGAIGIENWEKFTIYRDQWMKYKYNRTTEHRP